MTDDDLPGDFDTIEGITERARALGSEPFAQLVEDAENRIRWNEEKGGYEIAPPEGASEDDPLEEHVEMLFHLGILTGAAFEREYPAGDVVGGDG